MYRTQLKKAPAQTDGSPVWAGYKTPSLILKPGEDWGHRRCRPVPDRQGFPPRG